MATRSRRARSACSRRRLRSATSTPSSRARARSLSPRRRASTARRRSGPARTPRSRSRSRSRASTCFAQVVADGGYDTVLFANSVLAADIAAGLAARLDAGLNWDLADIELNGGELIGKRPALQDSVYVDVGWTSTPRLALFRAGSFDATETGGGEPEVVDVSPSVRRALDRR